MNQIEKKNKMKEDKKEKTWSMILTYVDFLNWQQAMKYMLIVLNLHEIKNEILQDYTGDFELNGKMNIGPVEHKTNIRFKNMDDFERYINAIDIDYDSEDVTFFGYLYKLDTPQFKVVN